jgi:hypothetical protein
MIKSRRIDRKRMQHVWRRRGMHREFWWERQKEKHHCEDLDIGGRIISKWIL